MFAGKKKTVILPPENVSVIFTSSTFVNVTWLPVSRVNNTQYPYNYTVKWTAVTQGVLGVGRSVTVPWTSFDIRGLAPFTTYRIQVAARDWDLTGWFSESVLMTTLEWGK